MMMEMWGPLLPDTEGRVSADGGEQLTLPVCSTPEPSTPVIVPDLSVWLNVDEDNDGEDMEDAFQKTASDPEVADNVSVERNSLRRLNTKGFPIFLVEGSDEMTVTQKYQFLDKHPTEMLQETITLPMDLWGELATASANSCIPFTYSDTDCMLLLSKDTVRLWNGNTPVKAIIKRPNVYYCSHSDPKRFPCRCLYLVDERTLSIFETIPSLDERMDQLDVFSKLSKAQQEHVVSMASRPVQAEVDQGSMFTPIRSEKALKMMYQLAKKTYCPDVRARIDTLWEQLSHSRGAERADLLNHLAMTIGIDTNPQPHPVRTYEEYMAILDKHIYGLQTLKESIVEFLMTMQHCGASYFVMLLEGPPGVGKTSICNGVAECLSVPLVHVDCEGKDVLAIGGVWMAYSGAKQGDITGKLLDEGRTDVLLLLDEFDKLEKSKEGDPYSAFIKALGPQRQHYDQYLGGDTDVSATKFIATANDIDKIPAYIRSRFENCIFHIDPYTEDEKVAIAVNYIIPALLKEVKLSAQDCVFEESALRLIIRDYCTDEGVRDMKGNLRQLLYKTISEWMRGHIQLPVTVDCNYVATYLRKPTKFWTPGKQIGIRVD